MPKLIRYLITLSCLVCAGSGASAANGLEAQPNFDSFRVAERSFSGKIAQPRLVTRQDREFRTALEDAAKHRPNFAGHFILTNIGCGASCVMTAVLDAKTGKVAWLPFTLCCWEDAVKEPVEFRIDSDLIVLQGRKDEGEAGTWMLRFIDGRFVAARAPQESH
jgi:hypothetical protein